MAKEATETFLGEAEEPSIVDYDTGRGAVSRFVEDGTRIRRQANELHALLQTAEIEEEDENVQGMFEQGFQKLGAMDREIQKAEKALRRVVRAYREFDGWRDRLREAVDGEEE